ncbi:uncharacterized protein LOC128217168 [Mya arenaria]|uniref:uncharacterized protein LOC128217168 n=1 Tax=Mya arenaria TaxID=6604 RepID=UPI0022E1C8AC|nr:uncharacterized protein LOC128217168 [Mya arenaria]
MDDEVKEVTQALQSVERLKLELRERNTEAGNDVFQKCVESLENLKFIKSSLEGSEVTVTTPEISEEFLTELKQQTLMHLPSSMTEAARGKILDLVQKTFQETDVVVVYVCLLTCPWYSCTQRERGEQAKYNQLFIVYQSTMARVVSPLNTNTVDQNNVIDKDWFYASELFHFVQFVSRGRTRNVEALYCPEGAIIYQSENWKQLRQTLDCTKIMRMRGFLEACRGQSVGGIGKKGKDGKFRLNEASTFRQLTDSFRLMHHGYNSVKGLPPCTTEFTHTDHLPEVAQRAVTMLNSMYQNPDISKKDVFAVLLEWQGQVDKEATNTYSPPEEVQGIVGNWHKHMRLQGKPVPLLRSLSDDHTELLSLMSEIGGPVSKLDPSQIVLITQAGSYMYNLNTATSDVDFLVIYAENTEKYLTACKRLPEIFESRGKNKQIEYGAYELRCFAEMVHKGSVVILELLYGDNHNYMSPAWKALCRHREGFVTENAISQYMGLIKNNLRMIDIGKHKDNSQERKLFYQIYHKLYSLEYMIEGAPPPVRCTGPVRDFIMRVRTAPLEGDLSREELHSDCRKKVAKFRNTLASRTTRLHENCDFNLLVDWILTVRGLSHS